MKKRILVVLVLLALVAGGLGIFLVIPAKPEYCWLVFGPEAKIWVLVCLQGNKVSIERDDDGEFPDSGKRLGTALGYLGCFTIDDVIIADRDKQTTYSITAMSRLDSSGAPHVSVNVHVQGPLEYRQYCDVELASSPQNAKEAHFHGPLTIEPLKANWVLHKGDKPTELRVTIGTMNAEKGCWVVVSTQRSKDQPTFPKGVHPFVDVEFPPTDPGMEPIRRRYPLAEPC